MGAVQNVIDRLRQAFISDKERGGSLLARGSTSPTYPDSGYDLLQAYGYDALSDYLRLEHDLLSRYVDYEEMDDYPEVSCISGDLRVLTARLPRNVLPSKEEGGMGVVGLEKRTVRELYEEFQAGRTDDLFVFALDHKSGRIKVAKASGPKKTGRGVQVYRVTYESYRRDKTWSLICTGDHLWMLRTGLYRAAMDLEPGDRLMPCTLKQTTLGYSAVYEPLRRTRSGKASYTNVHGLVVEAMCGRSLRDEESVHHKDRDKTNFRPSNLEITTTRAHVRKHAQSEADEERRIEAVRVGLRKKWADPSFRKRVSEAHRSPDPRWLDDEQAGNHKHFKAEGKLSEAHRAAIAKGRTIPLAPDVVEAAVRASASLNEAARSLNVSWNTLVRRMAQYDIDRDILGSNSGGPQLGDGEYLNHRVVSVERVGFEDVYDIEVPDYHNFAVGSEDGDGFVFVHNSAVDVYADDASQPDTQLQRTVWVTSRDKTLQGVLDDLFYKRLRLDEEVWELTRSLVKYGNDFEEMLVTGDGVVGLNFLPAPTVRRVEGPRGELYGFVQDFKGRFGYSPQEFQKILATRTDAIRQMMQPGVARQPGNMLQRVSALEPWEVAHFRLRGKHRRSVYGYCERATSKISTPLGVKEIQYLEPGDVVHVMDNSRMVSAKVLDVVCSGNKKVFSIKTRHRENFATAEHPVMVFSETSLLTYKPVSELCKGDLLVLPRPFEKDGILTRTKDPAIFDRVRLTSEGVEAVSRVRDGERYFYKRSGLKGVCNDVDIFCSGDMSVDQGTFSRMCGIVSELADPDVFVSHGRCRENFVRCPRYVDADFAWLFGLLLGDGWISLGHDVGVAVSLDEVLTEDIRERFRAYGLEPKDKYQRIIDEETGEEQRVLRQLVIHSADLVDILQGLGFVNGSKEKRVPQWVFESARGVREAFISGFMAADGWDVEQHGQCAERTELSNYELVRDLKTLIDGLGWTCGNVCVRAARQGKVSTHPAMRGKVVNSGPGYFIHFHTTPLFEGPYKLERVISVTKQDSPPEPVYDIEVDHEAHNFVADGLIVHNSILESSRWIWKRLMLLEDAAMIYRLQRAPERFAFYVDVGDLPPGEALAFVKKIRQEHKKKRFVNPSTGKLDLKFEPLSQDDDFWVPTRKGVDGTRIEVLGGPSWQCLVGDTRVLLLDGTQPTIQELAERACDFWVYSVDAEGRVVPGRGRAARMTHKAAEIWEVELDNGETIRCTGNHPFLGRDGKWSLAAHLRRGDSLMPSYRRFSKHTEGDYLDGYEQIYDPASDKFVYTHHRVFAETVGPPEKLWANGNIIHHKDHRKLNNTPDNLEALNRKAHAQEHAEYVRFMHTPEAKAKAAESNRSLKKRQAVRDAWTQDRHARHRKMMVERMSDKVLRAEKAKILSDWNRSEDHKEKIRGHCHPRWRDLTVDGLSYLVLATGARTIKELMRRGHVSQSVISRVLKTDSLTWNDFAHRYIPGWAPRGRALSLGNHKVVSVRKTENVAPVYDLTVAEHHNFAVASGVFVSNSMEDIQYFQNKLFSALKVPKAYLAQDENVARAVLSSEDVRFARSVLRVQREVCNGLRKVSRTHLAALSIDPYSVDYAIHMTVPSAIFELAQLEVRNARADLASRMKEHVSLRWVLENVYQLSDEDIGIIIKERSEDTVREGKDQAEVEKLSALAQGAAEKEMGGSAGGGAAAEAAGLPRGLRLLERKLDSLPRRLRGGISERELLHGNREAEKRADVKLDRLLQANDRNVHQIREIGALLREVSAAARGR